MDYQQTLDFLFQQLPMYQKDGKKAYKADLSNIIALCEILNHPERQLRCIHIAGTNGKGSSAHLIASVLQESGYKVGLYTSPHLKDFRERIKINGIEITEQEVIDFVACFQEQFLPIQPSFFEWTVALAFYYFQNQKVDIAVIETGLGGRLDSTNIIQPILSIITNIGLDHQDILGDTLAEISREKAGIIKKNTPVVIGDACGQEDIFNEISSALNAPIYYTAKQDFSNAFPNENSDYQEKNKQCVFTALSVLQELGWNISTQQINSGFKNWIKNTGIRARYEKLGLAPLIIADTAHNAEGLSLLLGQVNKEDYRRLHVILSVVDERKVNRLLKTLPRSASYYFTQSSNSRSLGVEKLAKLAKLFDLQGEIIQDPAKALEIAKQKASNHDLILITGSNFLIGELI